MFRLLKRPHVLANVGAMSGLAGFDAHWLKVNELLWSLQSTWSIFAVQHQVHRSPWVDVI